MDVTDIPTLATLAAGPVSALAPILGGLDPFGMTKFMSEAFRAASPMISGKVVMYHPQTHSAAVLANGRIMTCMVADETVPYGFGFLETNPLMEGDRVLIHRSGDKVDAGIIIGRLPYEFRFDDGDPYNDEDGYLRRAYTQLPGTSTEDIPGMSEPLRNKDDDTTHTYVMFRPTDVYPGGFAQLNQHNCGLLGGLFSVALMGGGASLRLSALSGCARMTCDSYLRHTMLGNVHEFHNGRYLSSERDVSMYQEERLGWNGPDSGNFSSNVWTEDSKAPAAGEDQTLRPRMKEMSGFFGHISSKFCMRPDPNDSEVRKLGAKPNEAGVSRETVDPSGQYRLSSAGMMVIERTGRIPVPVRVARPTDKGHDIGVNPSAMRLEPFSHKEGDPAYRQLELFDRQAYDLKNQYARVDGIGMDESDYHVPQEEDLKPLKDTYDDKYTGSETVRLEQYDRRRAGVYIGEDGSVIVRDAWGSEIVMLGGNVSISCAGNVMTLPGKTALTIAGDDIVQKAQNSVDIHASEHDVRLSAARNMEILGGGDENKYSGGVIIESRGKGSVAWDGVDKGEDARLCGIVLKGGQGVAVDGRIVAVRAEERLDIMSGKDSFDGRISIAAKEVVARSNAMVMSTGKAMTSLSDDQAVVSAGSIALWSDGKMRVVSNNEEPVPAKWTPYKSDSESEDVFSNKSKGTEYLEKENGASVYNREALDKMRFGFRSSEECGTDGPWTMGDSSGEFRMYEPAWIQVAKKYETLKNAGVETKPYEEKAEWDNGVPFPGKDAAEKGRYVELGGSDRSPENLTDDGFNKSRKDVKDKSAITTTSLKDGYLVRK